MRDSCNGRLEGSLNAQIVKFVEDFAERLKSALKTSIDNDRVKRDASAILNEYNHFNATLTMYTSHLKDDISSLLEDKELLGEMDKQAAQVSLDAISVNLDVPTLSPNDEASSRLIQLALDMLSDIEEWATDLQYSTKMQSYFLTNLITQYR